MPISMSNNKKPTVGTADTKIPRVKSAKPLNTVAAESFARGGKSFKKIVDPQSAIADPESKIAKRLGKPHLPKMAGVNSGTNGMMALKPIAPTKIKR